MRVGVVVFPHKFVVEWLLSPFMKRFIKSSVVCHPVEIRGKFTAVTKVIRQNDGTGRRMILHIRRTVIDRN